MLNRHKVALVTGGGTGIGAAVARRLAADGYPVTVTGQRAGPIEGVAANGAVRPVDGGHTPVDVGTIAFARASA